jgi:hypothetical protein
VPLLLSTDPFSSNTLPPPVHVAVPALSSDPPLNVDAAALLRLSIPLGATLSVPFVMFSAPLDVSLPLTVEAAPVTLVVPFTVSPPVVATVPPLKVERTGKRHCASALQGTAGNRQGAVDGRCIGEPERA